MINNYNFKNIYLTYINGRIMDINLSQYQEIYDKEKFAKTGLGESDINRFKAKYGENLLPKKKKKSIFAKIVSALLEPMIIILLFAWVITFGVSIGNLIAGKNADFYESIGILGAIFLSVGLTIVMENKSEKAFETLQKLSDAIYVSVLRNNKRIVIHYSEVCVGDLLYCEAGDKIVADGVIIEGEGIECEESVLTGEVIPVEKVPIINRIIKTNNMLFSGCYIKNGYALIRVLAVGKNAQMGKIACELQEDKTNDAPLTLKLTKLSKRISIFGGIAAAFTFILSLIRLYFANGLNFENIKEAFIQTIVLIVAAVPEGLPATVAIALALSVVKLAKSNAVIKKLIAAETVGCVSVICSDKTGTLTVGKMQAKKFYTKDNEYIPEKLPLNHIYNNIVYNSTATFVMDNGKIGSFGNSTEQALINALFAKNHKKLTELRNEVKIVNCEPFNSKRKYMSTTVYLGGQEVIYYKGSIEKIIEICKLSQNDSLSYLNLSNYYASQGERIIAFAHSIDNNVIYDGFCVISDEIRKEVYNSVKSCKKAGISVKILTGDNKNTAIGIAKKLSLPHDFSNILTGQETFNMSDEELMSVLPNITIIARSTPETKLRVVNLLKRMGEVVAVTGDGVNDAPAVKNADIGISMVDGSDITKEASDIILLDNSFSVIVKAVAFGRNIYRNFQRFLFFQLTVNLSAVGIIVTFLLLGFEAPFSTLQLLWINVIMDGPLALSLALERRDDEYMEDLPVKRTDSIVSKKMLVRIVLHSLIIIMVTILQKQYNFLGVKSNQASTVVFCIFVLFQLFNSINARELGTRSVFNGLGKNKIFSILLCVTLIMQIFITQVFCNLFTTVALSFELWLKILFLTLSIIGLSEIYKFVYSKIKQTKFYKKSLKGKSLLKI